MKKTLGVLNPGQKGRITRVGQGEGALIRRLLEIGLIEGSLFEVMHVAPYSGDPMAVRVRGATIALRRQEADQVEVELLK